jgi:hypothetical protein
MAAARLTVIDDADMHEGMLRQFLRNASAGFTATQVSSEQSSWPVRSERPACAHLDCPMFCASEKLV